MKKTKKTFCLYSAMLFIAFTACQNDLDNQAVNDSPETIKMEKNDFLFTPYANIAGESIMLKSGATVEKKGNLYFWQGDILLSEVQLQKLAETGTIETPPEKENEAAIPICIASGMKSIVPQGTSRNCGVYPTSYNLWAMVRYSVDPKILPNTRNLIRRAIEHWESRTNIRFYNATNEPVVDPTYGFEYPYVYFCNRPGNWSSVGRIGGQQILSIDSTEWRYTAVAHEIGHAIGLHHEQCRYDRDNYINVNLNNLDQERLKPSNYTKVTQNYYCRGAFDWESIMLYGSFDGAKNSNIPVMTRKDGTTWDDITSKQLSDLDRQWANYLYLPYIARSDVYRELDTVVYDGNNRQLTESERIQLQAQLNNGNPTPPAGGRIPNVH